MISGVKEILEAVSDSKRSMSGAHGTAGDPFSGYSNVLAKVPADGENCALIFSDLIARSLANPERTGVEYFRSVNAMPLGFLI
jgi:hypothetical protein